jgi:predicted DNA-binding transcriptional regulator AlpA
MITKSKRRTQTLAQRAAHEAMHDARSERARLKTWPRAVGWPSTQVYGWVRARVVAAGGRLEDVPEPPFSILRREQVKVVTGLSTASLYRLMPQGRFPRPIPIDTGKHTLVSAASAGAVKAASEPMSAAPKTTRGRRAAGAPA